MNQKLFDQQYLKHLCQKYGLVPSKKYGQNFLINQEVIEKMIEAAEINNDDVVVEVGPGFGVLTLALAEKAKKVLAFEIEKRLSPYWGEVFRCHPELVSGSHEMPKQVRHDKIEIVWGNVLNEFKGESLKGKEYKVVANLPYQITSQVMRTFLEMENKPECLVLMVQKEVAERICAKPSLPGVAGKRSQGEMSVLSVSVQYYGEPEIVLQVPRSYFWPVPGVDSAVIKVSLRGAASDEAIPRVGSANQGIAALPLVARNDKKNTEQFFKLVKAGFSSRRKMLIKNLSSIADKSVLRTVFKELGIDEKVRAQELSVEQWKELVHKVESL